MGTWNFHDMRVKTKAEKAPKYRKEKDTNSSFICRMPSGNTFKVIYVDSKEYAADPQKFVRQASMKLQLKVRDEDGRIRAVLGGSL